MVWVLIFGAVLTFGGYDKTEAKIMHGRSLFNLVLSVDNALLCMFQRLWTYFQDIGVLIFGGYVLSGHCGRQQISEKNEGYLFSEGYLFTGFYGNLKAQSHLPTPNPPPPQKKKNNGTKLMKTLINTVNPGYFVCILFSCISYVAAS